MSFPYSRKEVSRAGDVIRDASSFDADLNHALDVLGAWRSSHIHPLQSAYMNLRQRARKVDGKALVSQRLKRVPSIVTKLQRQPGMQLARMQDIGGCRAVLNNLPNVYSVARRFCENFTDYIEQPKPDGYRGIHLISKYQPAIPKHEDLAGRQIEIQIRTRLMHSWATAVETVDSLLNQNIKTGGGDEKWRRFFSLASSVIAIREQSSVTPGTPSDMDQLVEEIRDIDKTIRVRHRLSGLAVSVLEIAAKLPKNVAAYLLTLNLDKKTIENVIYLKDQLEDAMDDYLEQEKRYFADPSVQVVLVSVNKVNDLRKAYPNYYLNVNDFMKAMRDVWA